MLSAMALEDSTEFFFLDLAGALGARPGAVWHADVDLKDVEEEFSVGFWRSVIAAEREDLFVHKAPRPVAVDLGAFLRGWVENGAPPKDELPAELRAGCGLQALD